MYFCYKILINISMNRKIIQLIVICTLMFNLKVLNAQNNINGIFVGHVKSDTTTLIDSNSLTKMPSILKSKHKIELRLTISPAFVKKTYIVLAYDQKWNVKVYNDQNDSDKLTLIKKTVSLNLDTIFSRLVSNNIFGLTDPYSINYEYQYFNPKTNEFMRTITSTNDGTCYTIEFKLGNNFRRYGFYNPKVYAEAYPDICEFQNFSNIVSIFNELYKID